MDEELAENTKEITAPSEDDTGASDDANEGGPGEREAEVEVVPDVPEVAPEPQPGPAPAPEETEDSVEVVEPAPEEVQEVSNEPNPPAPPAPATPPEPVEAVQEAAVAPSGPETSSGSAPARSAEVAAAEVAERGSDDVGGVPAAVAALTATELQAAAALYAKRNQRRLSRKGVVARQQVAARNLAAITAYIGKHSPSGNAQIARALNLPPRRVAHYMQILTKNGTVQAEGWAQSRRYYKK